MMGLLHLILLQLVHPIPHSSAVGDQVAQAMREPHQVGIATIRQAGKQSHSLLQDLAFNEKWPMKTRWKSFMLLTQVQGKDSLPSIKKALQSKVWFMRSAGLTALESLDPQGAKKWAYKLLNSDPALMVRMKALEILKSDSSDKVTELLWKKVYSADSMYREQSLWIRKDLAQVLSHKPRSQDLARWVKLLHDEDPSLRSVASLALGKIHKQEDEGSRSLAYWLEKYPQKSL